MSVQKFLGTIETDGVKDERGIETPSLSATGEVSGKTGVFSESVTAPVLNGKATSAGSADSATNATNATNDGEGNNIPNTYATKEALSEETSAREAADNALQQNINSEASIRESADTALGGRIDDIVDGTTTVANATNATNATNANNVTTNINGQPISSIFESDGTTVKKATSYLHQIQMNNTDNLPTVYFSIVNSDNTPFTLETLLQYMQAKAIQTIAVSGVHAAVDAGNFVVSIAEKISPLRNNINITGYTIANISSAWQVLSDSASATSIVDTVSTAL